MSADVMAVLAELRDRFAAVPGVQSSKIGLEPTISPEDYPLVRIVPSIARNGPDNRPHVRQVDLLIYFGLPVLDIDTGGLEGVYAQLFALEALLRDALKPGSGWLARYRGTIFDEDRLDHYKLMALQVTVEG